MGNFSNLLNVTPLGALEPSIPILMFCIAYGLSMDYEVFILSRIKEEYDISGNLEESVALGIDRSAGLITGAAGILALGFAVYTFSDITFLKMLGVGMPLAIPVDSTVIRLIVVPSAMKMIGKANWWAPKVLKQWLPRFL